MSDDLYDLYNLYDLYDLYDLGHVAGWDSYSLHGLLIAHVSGWICMMQIPHNLSERSGEN